MFLNRSFVLYALKLFLTGAVIYFLLDLVNLAEMVQYLKNMSIFSVIASLLSLWFGLFLCAVRWQYLITISDHIALPLRELIRQVFISFSLSQVLPSSIGGDIYRIMTLKKYDLSTSKALSIVFLDRFYGLLGFMSLSLCMIPFFWETLLQTVVGKIVFILVLGISAGILALCILHRLPLRILDRAHFIKTAARDFYMSVTSHKIFGLLGITWMASFFVVLPAFLIARDLEIVITIPQILLLIPLVFLSAVLPVSFAGWGIREGAMVALLGVFAVSNEGALALSVVIGVLSFVGGLPGVLMLMIMRRQKQFPQTS